MYPRVAYKTFERAMLRGHPSMQVRMYVADHNELHANVPAITPITGRLARVALQFLDTQPANHSNFERFYDLNDYLGRLSRKMGKMAVESGKFNEHFNDQLKYMEYVEDGKL